jgi:hypothetical protein
MTKGDILHICSILISYPYLRVEDNRDIISCIFASLRYLPAPISNMTLDQFLGNRSDRASPQLGGLAVDVLRSRVSLLKYLHDLSPPFPEADAKKPPHRPTDDLLDGEGGIEASDRVLTSIHSHPSRSGCR